MLSRKLLDRSVSVLLIKVLVGEEHSKKTYSLCFETPRGIDSLFRNLHVPVFNATTMGESAYLAAGVV